MSEKREELIHMLDQMNIQVENPVAILNQDTSRNFLHSKSPQDKYKVRSGLYRHFPTMEHQSSLPVTTMWKFRISFLDLKFFHVITNQQSKLLEVEIVSGNMLIKFITGYKVYNSL